MWRWCWIGSPLLVLALASHAQAQGFMFGADVSSLPVLEASPNHPNYKATADGPAGDVLEILNDHGTNWFRLRLFVNPQFQNNFNGGFDPFVAQNLEYTIALAQRVKQLGANVLLDFHYSDTWADPGHQIKPAAWANLPFDDLVNQVHTYTRDVITAFKDAGVLPEMVQIGNEIPSGILWNSVASPNGPNTGYPWSGGNHDEGFDRLAALLDAGIQGAREGATMGDNPGPAPLVMIHHDRGDRVGDTSYFLSKLLVERDLDFDMIGFSYYPLWHFEQSNGVPTTLADVQDTLNYAAETYGKPVVIVETGFTRSNETGRTYEFPETPAGQQAFLQALVDLVQGVSNGLGRGVFWWYPEAQVVSGLPSFQGGRYGLFDANDVLLPAAHVFNEVQGDYNYDGFVDAADYTVWRNTLGEVGMALDADGDADGRVDQGDYNVWRHHFGKFTDRGGGSSGLSVPEPMGVVIVLQSLTLSALFISRRGARDNR